jgi:hypothetical protein
MKPTLTELAMKYGSDKLYAHSYIEVYQDLFDPNYVQKLLEVGIGHYDLMKDFTPKFVPHSSLRMWEEYCPFAQIFAADIREDVLLNEGRIHSMKCDQSQPDQLFKLANWCGNPQIIIDDGSHEMGHQALTALILFRYLAPNGLYIVEDVRDPDTLCSALNSIEGNYQMVAYKLGKRHDDNLIVMRAR